MNVIFKRFKPLKNKIDIRTLKDYLDSLNLTNNTKISTIKRLKTYLKYYYKIDPIFNIEHWLKSLTIPPNNPTNRTALTILQIEKIRAVFKIITKQNKKWSYLFLAFEIMLANGIRVNELEKINWWELDLSKTNYIEASKNGNYHPIFISKEIEFLIQNLKPFKFNKNYIRNLFNQFKIELKKYYPEFQNIKLSSHILRYTFITKAYKKGVDLPTISKLTGHKSIDMINKCYLTFDDHFLNYQFKIINSDFKEHEQDFKNELKNEKMKNEKLKYALNLAYDLINFYKHKQILYE